jgi:hypothetical protein
MAADDALDDEVYGPIVVKRAVYEEGLRLADDEKAGRTKGDKCFWVAERKANERKAAGDEAGAAYWNEVREFAFEYDVCRDKETEIIVLEEGETFDFKKREVIRPDKNPPRSHTGNQ